MIFNLGSAKVCSPAIIEPYFSYDKDILIAVTHYYLYFSLIVPFLLITTLQFINFTASYGHFSLKHYFALQTLFGPLHKWHHFVKVSWSFYCSISSISHGVKNCFPRLWGTGISDAIFSMMTLLDLEAGSKVMISSKLLLHLEALEPIIREI